MSIYPFSEIPQENYQYKRVATFSKWNLLDYYKKFQTGQFDLSSRIGFLGKVV
jgi:hypothetical protein